MNYFNTETVMTLSPFFNLLLLSRLQGAFEPGEKYYNPNSFVFIHLITNY